MNLDSPSESKGNILIVDDIPENLQLLSNLLLRSGYTVRSVTSGQMALKTIKVKQPDVIFLDIKMSEMDGYQICQFLKKDKDLRNIPVIFISALDDVFDKVAAFQSGGIDYITKPFQIEEVIARLENQLTIQRQQRLLEQENLEHKKTKEVLLQSRALLSSVLNSSLDGIAAMEAVRNHLTGRIEDFRYLVINPVIAKVFGSINADVFDKLLLKKHLQLIKPELFDQFVHLVETGETLEQDFYHPSSDACWYHFIAVKLDDGFAITIRDITARKQIELALQDANQKLKQLVNLDGLTHIANRRCFDEQLQKEWQRLAREEKPLSLVLLDVDNFKSYNDYYGHLAGDDCLIKITQTVQHSIHRSADLLARYGGEEFFVLLPNTDLEGAIKVVENIRQGIHQQAIPHPKSNVKDIVTVSFGIASVIPTPNIKPDSLIALADKALYNAKQQGRDRYSCHH